MDGLQQSQRSIERFDEFIRKLQAIIVVGEGKSTRKIIDDARKKIIAALDNDLNTPMAWAVVHELMKKINAIIDSGKIGKADAEKVLSFMKGLDTVFSVFRFGFEQELEPELLDLLKKRETARKGRNYAEADRLRDLLLEKGIKVDDTKEGQRWKKVQ